MKSDIVNSSSWRCSAQADVAELAYEFDPEHAEEGEGQEDRGRRTEDRRRRVAGLRGAEGGALVDRVSMGEGR